MRTTLISCAVIGTGLIAGMIASFCPPNIAVVVVLVAVSLGTLIGMNA